MLNAINNSVVTSEVTQPEAPKASKNISYRGADYERSPYNDSFESENKSNTGKTIGIIAGVLATAALVVGGICLHKGSKALEGAEEAEKTFGKKLKKGWQELWHKTEKAAEKEGEKAVEKEGEKAVEKEGEEVAKKEGKETGEEVAKKEGEEVAKKEGEEVTKKEGEETVEEVLENEVITPNPPAGE